MKSSQTIVVRNIARVDPVLQLVKELGRANKQTLGFFPDGAFDEHAAKGLIIVALAADERLAGYSIYRITRSLSAAIVHLCIHSDFRGTGITHALLNFLERETAHLRGVGLWCRNDFPAHNIWPRFGFVARSERTGKRKSGSDLTYWWKDHGIPDLLTSIANEKCGPKLAAVVDANVFFDLVDGADSDSTGLNLGWLRDEVDLQICPEMFNEISRDVDKSRREQRRIFANKFGEVSASNDDVQRVRALLVSAIPTRETVRDRSDILHLAQAVAGGAKAFVTRDDHLFNYADEVYEKTLVSVVRPADIVTRIDALLREQFYQRDRLAGTSLTAARENVIDEDLLASLFQADKQGERKNAFLTRLRKLRADPQNAGYLVVHDPDRNPIGILGYQRSAVGNTAVTTLRAKAGPLAISLMRYLVISLLIEVENTSASMTITDPYAASDVAEQLAGFGFVKTASGLAKLLVSGTLTLADVLDSLKSRLGTHAEVDDLISGSIRLITGFDIENKTEPLLTLERALWPLEIRDLEVPAYIIPIKPMYAQHLFDVGIAKADLFGANIDLALNQESVYYRSPKNSRGLASPARLLWYVSTNARIPGSGHIRAHSKLDEVDIGTAKTIFRKFRRLGIFGYKEVLEIAAKDSTAQVMAMRFSCSRMLERPIPWIEIKSMLHQHDVKSILISPTRIPTDLYFKLRGL